jgi:hypothetical protein
MHDDLRICAIALSRSGQDAAVCGTPRAAERTPPVSAPTLRHSGMRWYHARAMVTP